MKYERAQNEFYTWENREVFDDIIELNLSTGASASMYRVDNKYQFPEASDRTQRMVMEILRDTIHPEDGSRYMKFWDETDMIERILKSSLKRVSDEFRQKKTDGSWGWVRQTLVLSQGDSEETNVYCYVLDIDEEKKKDIDLLKEIENTHRVDRLTGLLRTKAFFHDVDAFAKENSLEGYAMIAVDLEHFKLFNEWYGWARGDKYLMDIATRLSGVATILKGFVGYMGGDNFAIFIKHRPEYIDHMIEEIDEFVSGMEIMAGFLPNLGFYFVGKDEKVPASSMYDRAVLALNTVRGNYGQRYAIYKDSMLREIGREMEILTDVMKGIERREFVIYMQPQVHVLTGKIAGAEALVRWKNREKGMISPGVFIPVLEKNGFITSLDKYIWEEVCAWQRSRLDRGLQVLPVSVNVSRVDMYSIDLVEYFVQLTDKYAIPRSCIKIEITESTYAENDSKIGKIAENLRKEGFSVYLDDFGSGYSSLNMLKNVYVDALKIDMQFLDMNESNAKKGESIMESVINMARILRIPIIVEGAETEREINSLTGMGCRYVQGFYYYKPMPIIEFEELLATKEVDYTGLRMKNVGQVHMRELFEDNTFSDTMINNILGAVAFYDMYRGKVELTSVNEQFYQVMGMDAADFDAYKENIKKDEYNEHQKMFQEILNEAYENPVSGAEYNYVGKTPSGEKIYLHIRAFFLRESEGHRIFYVGYTDTGKKIIDKSETV